MFINYFFSNQIKDSNSTTVIAFITGLQCQDEIDDSRCITQTLNFYYNLLPTTVRIIFNDCNYIFFSDSFSSIVRL